MKIYWAAKLYTLLLIASLSFQACSSSGSAQRPAAGSEYEITDREKIEREDSLLVNKYASILDTDYSTIKQSFTLYKFIDQQINTPCSDTPGENTTNYGELTQQIFEHVYNRKVPATYDELKDSQLIPKFSDRSYLAEGDLIFFEYEDDSSMPAAQSQSTEKAVGLYLQNNKFVICSEEFGAVIINDLNSRYWNRRYKMAGRLK